MPIVTRQGASYGKVRRWRLYFVVMTHHHMAADDNKQGGGSPAGAAPASRPLSPRCIRFSYMGNRKGASVPYPSQSFKPSALFAQKTFTLSLMLIYVAAHICCWAWNAFPSTRLFTHQCRHCPHRQLLSPATFSPLAPHVSAHPPVKLLQCAQQYASPKRRRALSCFGAAAPSHPIPSHHMRPEK